MYNWGTTNAFWNISEQELATIPLAENVSEYRMALRSRVRGFWAGHSGYADFVSGFSSDIRWGISLAWEQGTAECGIMPSEWSVKEVQAMNAFITEQTMQVGFFAIAIEANTKATGGKLTPLLSRTELWINRYNEAKTLAAAMACSDRKKIWVLGPTETHCKSCGGFAGRVYRFSVWLANGALTQSRRLICGGLR